MQNFDYKTLLYYAPPVVIILFVAGYYIYFNDLPQTKQLENTKSQQVNKSEIGLITDAFNQNNFTEANKLADEMLSRDKDNIQALLLKAQNLAQEASLTFKEKQLGDQARAIALQVLKLDPNNTAALTLIGYTYEIQENYTQAHKYYDQALSIDQYLAAALDHKGHTYDLQGDLQNAEIFYKKAIAANEKFPKTYSHLGRIYIIIGKREEAKKNLEKFLTLTQNIRDKSETYYALGNLSETRAFSQASYDYYKLAVDTDPSLDIAYVGLAKEQFLNNQSSESFNNLSKALEVNPHLTAAGIQLAIQLYASNNPQAAKTVLNKLAGTTKNDITLNATSKKIMEAAIQELLKIVN